MACLGYFVASAHALALSEIELKSYLNQRLDVRIELMSIEQSDLDGLTVILTSSTGDNATRHQLKHELLRSESGNFLKITSEDVIREPIVSFQLDINWPNGRVVREYSLLIDPSGN